mgnify:FL=1|tara:strand:+ start:12119 stop:12349 length:231 start_codon:yes stop_codon:yes gene_type:complete
MPAADDDSQFNIVDIIYHRINMRPGPDIMGAAHIKAGQRQLTQACSGSSNEFFLAYCNTIIRDHNILCWVSPNHAC